MKCNRTLSIVPMKINVMLSNDNNSNRDDSATHRSKKVSGRSIDMKRSGTELPIKV